MQARAAAHGEPIVLALAFVACTDDVTAPSPGWQLGDGSTGSARIELAYEPVGPIYEPAQPVRATELPFHPDREGELRIVHRVDPPTEPCDEVDTNGTFASCGVLAVDPGDAMGGAVGLSLGGTF